jgi:hypothetical protein
MAEAFAKFRVGTPGAGAAHASYITRTSALEPNSWRSRGGQLELADAQIGVGAALEADLNDHSVDRAGVPDDADPVWTWNAPSYLTGDHYGLQEEKSSHVLNRVGRNNSSRHDRITAGITSPSRRQRLEEK